MSRKAKTVALSVNERKAQAAAHTTRKAISTGLKATKSGLITAKDYGLAGLGIARVFVTTLVKG